MGLITPPLALYVHFPWCVRKCPYCDFNSYTLREELPEARYVEALCAEMRSLAPPLAGRPRVSVFLGGGTPSLFSPDAIGRVLERARSTFGFEGVIEITLEANPGAVERGRFAEYRAAGVNRVSLGAQSFDARRLEALGRIHSPEETRRAAAELHAAGIANFNLDLMYALPHQDVPGALADVAAALALAPAHLSHYQLTIESGTVFAGLPPPLPEEDVAADMLAACEAKLAESGFARYETSAYAAPGRQCGHNLNYWRFGDYLGVGAGAHGKLTETARGRIVRTAQVREPRRYLASGAAAPGMPVAPEDLPFEFMLNALRLSAGFESTLFEARTGLGWDVVAPVMESLEAAALVTRSASGWQPSPLGARFLNDLLVRFLPDAPATARVGLSREPHAAVRGGLYSQPRTGSEVNE